MKLNESVPVMPYALVAASTTWLTPACNWMPASVGAASNVPKKWKGCSKSLD